MILVRLESRGSGGWSGRIEAVYYRSYLSARQVRPSRSASTNPLANFPSTSMPILVGRPTNSPGANA